jgi:hypothetical protein
VNRIPETGGIDLQIGGGLVHAAVPWRLDTAVAFQ